MDESRHLVEEASRGDPGAIGVLIERHLPALRRYVGHRAGREVLDRESESDVVQSVCRELLEGLREERFEYRGEREFQRWLYAAALFKLQSRRRRWRTLKRGEVKEGRLDAGPEGALPEPAAPTTPSVEASRAEGHSRILLMRALARLAALGARRRG